MTSKSRFQIGDIVEHCQFGYRGVVFDVHDEFELTDEWYEKTAPDKPNKDSPWYHVLVHNAAHTTYVAQENLENSGNEEQINHPELGKYFNQFIEGRYR